MSGIKVKVVNTQTGEVVKVFDATNQRQADRLEGGLNINLNHDKFHTVQETVKEGGAA